MRRKRTVVIPADPFTLQRISSGFGYMASSLRLLLRHPKSQIGVSYVLLLFEFGIFTILQVAQRFLRRIGPSQFKS